jgi:hypothetical protein
MTCLPCLTLEIPCFVIYGYSLWNSLSGIDYLSEVWIEFKYSMVPCSYCTVFGSHYLVVPQSREQLSSSRDGSRPGGSRIGGV